MMVYLYIYFRVIEFVILWNFVMIDRVKYELSRIKGKNEFVLVEGKFFCLDCFKYYFNNKVL